MCTYFSEQRSIDFLVILFLRDHSLALGDVVLKSKLLN